MKCRICKGVGKLQDAFKDEECDVCNGTGEIK